MSEYSIIRMIWPGNCWKLSPMALLEIDDLAVAFGPAAHPTTVVDGVTFAIDAHETVALVGESGSGKSVTALAIMRLLQEPGRIVRGAIRFEGRDLARLDERAMARIRGDRIAMIFQEPMTSLNPLMSVGAHVAEPLRLHRSLSRREARARAIQLLDRVGIPSAARRYDDYPHRLSGGMRQRVMIAAALACEPALLIADEPTTALDVTIQAQILKLLKTLQARYGMALLFITHDLGIVRKVADRVCVMTKGQIVEQGPVAQVFDHPQHAYTQHLLSAEPKGRPAVVDPAAPEILKLDDLKVHFPIKRGVLRRTVGHIKAVDGVSLSLREGHTIGLVGESGSGKTTLGLALLRLEGSTGGIAFDRQDLQALAQRDLRPLRRQMQIVFQDPFSSLSPRMSVGEIVGEGLEVHRIGSEAERSAMIDQALTEVGLDPSVRDRYPHEFSGGQRQRIAIARAVVLKPRLIVLDEPTSALDMSVQAQIVDLLRDLQTRHKLAYLFISHDLKVVRALADEVLVLRHGKVVERGPARQIFEQTQTPYTQALIAAAFNLEAIGADRGTGAT